MRRNAGGGGRKANGWQWKGGVDRRGEWMRRRGGENGDSVMYNDMGDVKN